MEPHKNLDGGWGDDGADFVTLAKAGGRKDLLKHIEYSQPAGQEPVPYSTVDWFAHPSPPTPSSPAPHLPPSLLQWPASLEEEKERKRRDRKGHGKSQKKTSEKAIKLPKVEPAVDMSQLLAMDYQKVWLQEREQKAIEKKKQAQEKRIVQRKKLEEHTMRARRVCGVESGRGGETERPRFIMKRFANVPSRVKLPPLPTTKSTTHS